MEAAIFLTLAMTCAPQVHPDTARALVAVESSFNPLRDWRGPRCARAPAT
jgi:hypothetical protein